MEEHQHLLDEAREFCDPISGEVVKLIPDDLMQRLRAARLAVGIRGEESSIATQAKWFVLFDDEIRERVLPRWRKARRKRRHTSRPEDNPPEEASTREMPCNTQAERMTVRGLSSFVQNRKSDQQ